MHELPTRQRHNVDRFRRKRRLAHMHFHRGAARLTFTCAIYAAAEKLAAAAVSSSYVSNTETSFVMVRRSCNRLVTRISFNVPPDFLILAYARTRSPSPSLSMWATFPRSTSTCL